MPIAVSAKSDDCQPRNNSGRLRQVERSSKPGAERSLHLISLVAVLAVVPPASKSHLTRI